MSSDVRRVAVVGDCPLFRCGLAQVVDTAPDLVFALGARSVDEVDGRLVRGDVVDFSQFDSQGRGIVDSVCIMYAGRTEYKGDLWPHNWVHRQAYDGMRTELYTVTSMGRSPDDLSIGTYCHESGHLLCRWPDLYDYGTAEREGDDFTSAGMGTYCVMGAGNHLGDGRTPSPVCVYLRRLVGWCGQDVDIAGADNYVAKHGDYDTALIYQHPERADTEYFLVENRSRDDFDVNLTASGLAVYHCDIDGSNEFQQGTSAHHYQCALMQADGHLDLETNANQGDGRRSVRTDRGHRTVAQQPPGISVVGRKRVRPHHLAGQRSGPGDHIPHGDTGSGGYLRRRKVLARRGDLRGERRRSDRRHHAAGPGHGPGAGGLDRYRAPPHRRSACVLLSPTGRRAVLHNRTGGSTNDLRLSLDSRPPSLLAPLVGEGVAGEWRLRITDAAESSTGKLLHWELHVRTGT